MSGERANSAQSASGVFAEQTSEEAITLSMLSSRRETLGIAVTLIRGGAYYFWKLQTGNGLMPPVAVFILFQKLPITVDTFYRVVVRDEFD